MDKEWKNLLDRNARWASLSPEEKKVEMYLQQKHTLDLFLERNTIDRRQYDKSLGDMTELMGMQEVLKELDTSGLINPDVTI